MKVRDVMTPDVISVRTDTPFRAIVGLMRGHRVTGLPVVDGEDRVLGVVTEADLVAKGHRDRRFPTFGPLRRPDDDGTRRRMQGTVAGELMTTPAVTVDAAADLRFAARRMYVHHIKRLPVTSDGRLAGIVSRRDVLKAFTRTDADIRREIKTNVLGRKLLGRNDDVCIDVLDGVVSIRGRVQRKSTANVVRFHLDRIDGLTKVVDDLTFDVDDVEPDAARVPAPGPIELFI